MPHPARGVISVESSLTRSLATRFATNELFTLTGDRCLDVWPYKNDVLQAATQRSRRQVSELSWVRALPRLRFFSV